MRNCEESGHIEVEHERVCLACDKQLLATDLVSVHIKRAADPETRGIATQDAWGEVGYGG